MEISQVKIAGWKKFLLQTGIIGAVSVGNFQLEGFAAKIRFFAIHCSEHGFQVDYKHGWHGEEYLECQVHGCKYTVRGVL